MQGHRRHPHGRQRRRHLLTAPELTAKPVIAIGGWHPGFVKVLRIEQVDDLAVAFLDPNGDGYEYEDDFYAFRDGRWRSGSSSGFTAFNGGGWWRHDEGRGLAYRCGTGEPSTLKLVIWDDEEILAPIDHQGRWVVARARETSPSWDAVTVVNP